MADELNRLKDILSNAGQNKTLVGLLRKQMVKVNAAVDELNEMLALDYVPALKQPKKKAEPKLGENAGVKRGAGRPKSARKAETGTNAAEQ